MSSLRIGEDPELIRLAESLDLTPAVVARRLDVLGLEPAHRAHLRVVGPQARAFAPGFLDGFYERLLRCPSTRPLLASADLVARLKTQQRDYLRDLFEAEYDWDHALRCLKIGAAHHRVRLNPQWFVASYGLFLCEHLPLLVEASSSIEDAIERLVTLLRSALFDASLVLDGYAMSAAHAASAQRVSLPTAAAVVTPASAPAASSHTPVVSKTRVAVDEASERCAFLGLDDAVLGELRALGPIAERDIPTVLQEFYDLFSGWDETRALVPDATVERLKRQVGSYWIELFRGDFGRAYAASRTLVGIVHERVGLASQHYVIGLARQVTSLLRLAVLRSPSPAAAADALLRAVFFDVSFVVQAYVQASAEALLRADGFAAELLAGLTAGVALIDPRMRVEAVNPALLHLFGLDAALVRFVQLREVVPIPAAVELARRAWERPDARITAVVERDGRTFRATAMRLHAPSAHPSGGVALVLDEITDIVRVQSEVRHAERGYASVIDAVRALIWECDDETFTLTTVSRSSLDVTGYRDVALLGMFRGAFLNLIPEVDRAEFVRRCRALRVGDKTEFHHRIVRSDGATVWVRSQVGRGPGPDGLPVLGGVTMDVTASHLAEERKLEAIGQLSGGIAHEYNNRLAVILTSLSLLEEAALSQEQGELVSEARRSAERCAALTRQILSVAQRQFLRPKPVVLNDVLGSAQHTLARALGDDVQFELRLAPDLWRCNVDVKELEAAIVSLITNARDSMPAGGRVTVSTRNVPANDASQPEPDGQDLVEVSVEDTGVGMDPSVQRRAFEPFFTTKTAGTGLGLSTVHGFVTQSGGRVSLVSESGCGTVVRLRFPRLQERGAPAVAASDGRPFVLAIDDEPSLRFVLERLLARLGCAATVVGSTAEAVSVLRSRRVDALVADVALANGESGAALAPEARAIQPGLPVIFISGFTREELRLEDLDARSWFLAKPFATEDFARTLRDAVAAGRAVRRMA